MAASSAGDSGPESAVGFGSRPTYNSPRVATKVGPPRRTVPSIWRAREGERAR
jgi:hypothetical protein